jgi:hypothetical protein
MTATQVIKIYEILLKYVDKDVAIKIIGEIEEALKN